MKSPKKLVSDLAFSGEIALNSRKNSEVKRNREWAALLRSLQERRRILRRRAVLASQLEQLRATASAQLQASAARRNRK